MATKAQTKIIDDPIIKVGDVTLFKVGNSVKMKTGRGKREVKMSTAGGGQLRPVSSSDVESRKSEVEFEMFSTSENIDILTTLGREADNGDFTTLEIIDSAKTYTFGMVMLIEGDEFDLKKDGNAKIKFEGTPLNA